MKENYNWFYLDTKNDNAQKGPLKERDIQVLWKTRQINQYTYVWRKGLLEVILIFQWKTIEECQGGLYERLIDMEEESMLIQQKLMDIKNIEKEKNLEEQVNNILDEMMRFGDSDSEGDPKKKVKKEIDYSNLTEEEIKKKKKNQKKQVKAAEKRKIEQYKSKTNTAVYVKGLPEDISFDELKEFFMRAGIMKIDIDTNQEKIKIYTDESDRCKGDALIMYAMEESVQIAIDMLHEREIRPGYQVKITKAEFQQKDQNYFKNHYQKRDKLKAIRQKAQQDRQLNWNDQMQGEGLKIVIIKNVFTLEEAKMIELYFQELEEDLRFECEMNCGPIQRIKIYEYNPLGVVQIKFKTDVAAERCINLMNGRWFSQRQLTCEYYDGITNYNESFEDQEKRLNQFGDWLESH